MGARGRKPFNSGHLHVVRDVVSRYVFYLFENLTGAPLHWNDDNANAIIVAVSNGVITTPIVSGYNSAFIGVESEPGA